MDGFEGYDGFGVDQQFGAYEVGQSPQMPLSVLSRPQQQAPPPQLPPPMPPPPGAFPMARPPPGYAPRYARRAVGDDGSGIAPGSGHMLGMSIILPTIGSLIGIKYAGLYGGLGGALAAGSAINLYRAMKYMLQGDPASDREAMISGTYAVVGMGGAGYLFWRGMQRQQPELLRNRLDDGYGGESLRGVE